jgi:hypothetical protein
MSIPLRLATAVPRRIPNKKLSTYQLRYHRAAEISVRLLTLSFDLIARELA